MITIIFAAYAFGVIAPAMMGNVLGYHNRLLIGVVAGSIFIASTLGQFMQDKLLLHLRLLDMISEGRLYKLNCILVKPKAGGEFICERNVFNLFGRFILFRPDLHQHQVSKIERGNRWLLSFALTQS